MARQKTGGRTKGTPNKLTSEIRELARTHAPAGIRELARLAKKAESEQARITAIGMLLDRGYGKATQPMEVSGPDMGPIKLLDVTDEHRAKAMAVFMAKQKGKRDV